MRLRPFVAPIAATALLALCSTATVFAGVEPQPFRTGLFGITLGRRSA